MDGTPIESKRTIIKNSVLISWLRSIMVACIALGFWLGVNEIRVILSKETDEKQDEKIELFYFFKITRNKIGSKLYNSLGGAQISDR